MTCRIIEGNVFDALPTLKEGSVDACVTSPPYWMLRSYLPKGHALKPLELGSEPTVEGYIENMVRVFREVWRVLADHGTVWLNLGSTYASGDMHSSLPPVPANAPECGIGGKESRYSQAADRACPGSCDEPQGEIPNRHADSARNGLFASQGEPLTALTARDSEHSDCAPGASDASLPDVQESTMPSLPSSGQDVSGPSKKASASRRGRRKVSPSIHPSEHTSACTGGTSPPSRTSADYTQGKESFSSACKRSDCRGVGNCGLCWCSLAIPSLRFKAGDLIDIPQLVKFALQADGWICRSVICWVKPAPMPQSLTGWHWIRCRVKVGNRRHGGEGHYGGEMKNGISGNTARVPNYTQWSDCPGCPKCEPHGGYVLRRGSWRPTSSWEPVLMLAKSGNYFCDGESVKLPPSAATVARDQYTRILDDPEEQFAVQHDHETICTGANPRDVWTIAAEPLSERHYASFPTELVNRCLRAATSAKGYCPACGAPWARVLESSSETELLRETRRGTDGYGSGGLERGSRFGSETPGFTPETKTLGWRATCSCPEQEPRPAKVLDPFCGSGRTGIQAIRLGLDFVGCELNPAYVEMAERLLREESPLFA